MWYPMQRFHLQEIYMQGTGSVSCQEQRNLWHCNVLYQNFSCHVTLRLKTKLQFNIWVTSGSYLDCSVGHIWTVL